MLIVETAWTDEQVTRLWSMVFGSVFETWSWWREVDFLEGDWDKPGLVRLVIEDPDDESKTFTRTVNAKDVVVAFNKAVMRGYRDTCTGRPINQQDMDACVGDTILQLAVLNDVIYG